MKVLGKRIFSNLSNKTKFWATLGMTSSLYAGIWYKARKSESEVFRIGIAGSLSVLTVELLYYPFDWMNNIMTIKAKNNGTLRAMHKVIKTEGIGRLYHGSSSTFYGAILYGYAYFWVYKYLKKLTRPYFEKYNAMALMYFVMAGFSDLVALLIYFPFEVVKLRMQWVNEHYNYTGALNGFRDLYKSYGLFGVYKGYIAYSMNYVANYSIQFMLYEIIISNVKSKLGKEYYYSHDDLIVILTSMVWGFFGGGLTNGFEVLAVRKQANIHEPMLDVIKDLKWKLFTSGIKTRVFYHTYQSIGLFYVLHLFGKLYDIELNDD